MYTAAQVTDLINEWLKPVHGYTLSEIAVKIAKVCIGWPYVWGSYGQYCTVSNRKAYSERSSCPEGEVKEIIKKCQRLNSGKSTCEGCKYYPNAVTRIFDCRGFTRWVLNQLGLTLTGAGATSQWNTNSNWASKGVIADIPRDKVCCVFMKKDNTMSHTGLHIGDGVIIHCSGEVKYGNVTDRGWSHYAIPVGLDGAAPTPDPARTKPTIRRGSVGQYVTECQQILLKLGYDLGIYGADGQFGAKTEEAVKKFQKANGLTADGIVGYNTWTKLLDNPSPAPIKYYTVTIEHLTEDRVNALMKEYPELKKKEE